jgi:hypothetical protein
MTSSSSMIVMRVFPGDGMTAPRLALLKSYSSRMVSVCLATTGPASGNQARPLSAMGVDDHQHSPQGICTQSDEALFALRIGILECIFNAIYKVTTVRLKVEQIQLVSDVGRIDLGCVGLQDA